MALKEISFHSAVDIDIEKAINRYKFISDNLLRQLYNRIHEALLQIKVNPYGWPIYRNNIRKKVIKQFPYVIFFEVLSEEIFIYAIASAKMEPGYWLERVPTILG